jgi:hypothetical protein
VAADRHITRAAAGLRILSWIADEAPRLENGTLRVDQGAPVIRDAEAWSATRGAA